METAADQPPKRHPAKRRWTSVGWLLVFLLGSWVALFAGPLAYAVAPILITGAAVLAQKRRWCVLVVLLLANPVSVCVGGGVTDYFSRRPTIYGRGLPNLQSYNLNPDTRCFRGGGGCIGFCSDWVTQDAHNYALKAMVSIFGLPPHAYKGPYPTLEEALDVVKIAESTPRNVFTQGRVIVGGQEIQLLAPGDVKVIEHALPSLEMPDERKLVIQAAYFREQCLVLRVADAGSDREKWPELLMFFDRGNGRWFACMSVPEYSLGAGIPWQIKGWGKE